MRRLLIATLALALFSLWAGGGAFADNKKKDAAPKGPAASASKAAPDADGQEHINFTENEGFLTHRFAENPKAGNILILRGKIRNDYPQTRTGVKVEGILEDKDGKVIARETVYAGLNYSDAELIGGSVPAIKSALASRSSGKAGALDVAAGRELSFLIVFDKLPPNISVYQVKIVSSEAARP